MRPSIRRTARAPWESKECETVGEVRGSGHPDGPFRFEDGRGVVADYVHPGASEFMRPGRGDGRFEDVDGPGRKKPNVRGAKIPPHDLMRERAADFINGVPRRPRENNHVVET